LFPKTSIGGNGGHGADGDAVPLGADHLVVDLDQERADEADDRLDVGEDLHHVGAPLEVTVDGVAGPDLGPVAGREGGVGEQVVLHGLEALADLWRDAAELVHELAGAG
jgi:hypothetical protein